MIPLGSCIARRQAAYAGIGGLNMVHEIRGTSDPAEVLVVLRRWEARVYHRGAAEQADGHHLYRRVQRGGHLLLRRRGGRGCRWLRLRLRDEVSGFAGEFLKPLP